MLDNIVEITRFPFSGHVYNLQTENNFYSANDIIVHNCRSTSVPIVKSWRDIGIDLDEAPEGTRSSMDGQVPADVTYEQWLKDKPEEFQNDVLGVGKAKLWREGKIGFTDLLDQRGNPLSLKQLRERLKRK